MPQNQYLFHSLLTYISVQSESIFFLQTIFNFFFIKLFMIFNLNNKIKSKKIVYTIFYPRRKTINFFAAFLITVSPCVVLNILLRKTANRIHFGGKSVAEIYRIHLSLTSLLIPLFIIRLFFMILSTTVLFVLRVSLLSYRGVALSFRPSLSNVSAVNPCTISWHGILGNLIRRMKNTK